jgi:hypothetical protein
MANHLQTLADSNYPLAEGEQDIRGWEVKNGNGDYIGEVKEILFDVAHGKMRYLIVDLNNNELGLEEHLVLIPVGLAEVHQEEDEVMLPTIKVSQLLMLQPYSAADFDSSMEESVQAAYIGTETQSGIDVTEIPRGYAHENFNSDNLFKKRRRITEQQEQTVLFPVNENLDDQLEVSTEGNMIDGADLDIPSDVNDELRQ